MMKSRKFVVLSAMTLVFALVCMLFAVLRSSAAGTNRYVAPTGANTGDCTFSPCLTIQYAVNQSAAGDTINVAAGTYFDLVDIPATLTGLTLKGAQAGNSVSGRTFGGVSESTVNVGFPIGNNSVFTIRSSGVTIDGFSVRNAKFGGPMFNAVGSATGIDVKNTASGSLITNNILDGIDTVDPNGTAQAVYLEAGPDNVNIVANKMNGIQSARSAKGVFIGDSNSSDPSLNILVEGNSFTGIQSFARGAYGVLANNGASTAAAATGYTTVIIRGNTFDGLNGGGWAHAIGLEGDTPNAQVLDNSISNVTAGSGDRVAVLFQDNPSFPSGQVHNNNFDVPGGYGIEVDTTIRDASGNPTAGVLTGGPVDGTCNWWGSANGPGPIGPGSGALVTANVTYAPWLNAAAPGGVCIGGFTKKECEKFFEEQKKDFDKQREADNKAFEQQQKADKEAFEAAPHTPAEKKAFHDQQEAAKKTFHDQQEADKKAFEQQNHDNKEQCKSLPK